MMDLRKSIYTVFFLLMLSLRVLAQDDLSRERSIQSSDYKSSIELAKRTGSIDPVDKLLSSNSITYPEILGELYRFKAEFLKEKIMSSDRVLPSEHEVDVVFKCYDSVNRYIPCKYKLENEVKKLDMLDHLQRRSNDAFDTMYTNSLDSLKQKGYKDKRDGVGLGFHYFVGKENWIGLNFSVFSYYQPTIRIRDFCDGEFYHYRKRILNGDLLKFSYSHSLNTSKRDVSLSVFESTGPIVVIPAKFGFVFGPHENESGFYYRPGIGLSIWLISLSYSYNFVYLPESRAVSEQNLFCIGFSYPVVKRVDNKKY